MREPTDARPNLAGQLLLAHPGLKDASFRRAVILLSADDPAGALGVVLNRPLGRRLGQVMPAFALGPLAEVPLYRGGPVEPEKLLLAAWRRRVVDEQFELHFGVEPAKAALLAAQPEVTVRAFVGYAGWSRGQLGNELQGSTWFVAAPSDYNLTVADGPELWRLILGSLNPELKLLANEPEDPSVN